MKKIAISMMVVVCVAVTVFIFYKNTQVPLSHTFKKPVLKNQEYKEKNEPNKKDNYKEKEEIAEFESFDPFSISILYDNNIYNEDLQTGWGFSCFVKGHKKGILFDTGEDGTVLLNNMMKMNIDPKDVDVIVLSHSHHDHTGGLLSFLRVNSDVTVYMLDSFPDSLKENAEKLGATVIGVSNPVTIYNDVYTTGAMTKNIPEQSLIIETESGSIVITGCAHPGIVSVAKEAQDISGNILLIMGGFHLKGTSSGTIQNIISQLKELDVVYVAPCHCTGSAALQLFEEEFASYYVPAGVGRIIIVHELIQE